jgi:hypothetical protein
MFGILNRRRTMLSLEKAGWRVDCRRNLDDVLAIGGRILRTPGVKQITPRDSEAGIGKYRRQGFEGHVCDLESGLDYPDARFDVVFCSEPAPPSNR